MERLRNVGVRLRPQYRSSQGGPVRQVPMGAFARVRKNGYADAWILVQRESIQAQGDGYSKPCPGRQAHSHHRCSRIA